jgi:hypothetical protein
VRGRKYAVGKAEQYIDNEIEEEKTYAYRLDKERGKRIYEGREVTIYERTRGMPEPGVVKAQTLNGGKSAYLSWEADRGADEYRIMRAADDGGAVVFSEREDGADGFYYQGETTALDSALEDDKGYLYRLDKKRDGAWQIGIEITRFSRTRPYPYGEAPVAESFRPDGYIKVRWHYDEGADQYVLVRRYDDPLHGSLGPPETVYAGTGLEYTDVTVNSEQNGRYVYVLRKERNGIEYRWDELRTYAVAVKTQEDGNEPNNLEGEATLLEDYRLGNVYYFAFSEAGRVVSDIDWYKVSIPAGKTANIAVVYGGGGTPYSEYFRLYDPHKELVPIVHNRSFQIKNDGMTQRYKYFALVPDGSKFAGGGVPGGEVVSYTITWETITND